MTAINTLILVAVIAWVLQIILGWLQVNRFNRAFAALAQKGKVGIGRTPGRFKAKSVVALAFDKEMKVVDALIMKGFTVFSSPQPIANLIGLSLQEIQPQQIFPNNRNAQEALREAIQLK